MSEYAGRDPRRLTFAITSFIRADMNFHESLKNEKKIYSMLPNKQLIFNCESQTKISAKVRPEEKLSTSYATAYC